ncbi:MAG: RNA polymerase sigma factor [Bacteroidales bacterium]|nr:RNA polymerase sigma factor [Bacteroidales bacterium]
MKEKPGSKPIDELVRRAIIGDGTAFTELWDTHIGALRTYLRGAMKHLDDFYIDDICSRSFEKAFRQIRSFDPAKSQFSTWLRTIAHNTALDTIDAENRAQSRLVHLDKESSGTGPLLDTIGDETATPLEQIVKEEEDEKLERYIEGLPELYRTIARMRLVDGLQYKEISEELGMELNTVRTRIRRAKAIIESMKASDS